MGSPPPNKLHTPTLPRSEAAGHREGPAKLFARALYILRAPSPWVRRAGRRRGRRRGPERSRRGPGAVPARSRRGPGAVPAQTAPRGGPPALDLHFAQRHSTFTPPPTRRQLTKASSPHGGVGATDPAVVWAPPPLAVYSTARGATNARVTSLFAPRRPETLKVKEEKKGEKSAVRVKVDGHRWRQGRGWRARS